MQHAKGVDWVVPAKAGLPAFCSNRLSPVAALCLLSACTASMYNQSPCLLSTYSMVYCQGCTDVASLESSLDQVQSRSDKVQFSTTAHVSSKMSVCAMLCLQRPTAQLACSVSKHAVPAGLANTDSLHGLHAAFCEHSRMHHHVFRAQMHARPKCTCNIMLLVCEQEARSSVVTSCSGFLWKQ